MRWLIALGLFALLCAGSALAANVGYSVLLREADAYSTAVSAGSDPNAGFTMTDEQYRHMDSLYIRGQALSQLVTPLTIGALGATFGVLGVLAVWRDRPRRVAAGQAEATPAS
jgi:hypothetical protein